MFLSFLEPAGSVCFAPRLSPPWSGTLLRSVLQLQRDKSKFFQVTVSRRNAAMTFLCTSLSVVGDPCLEEIKLDFSGPDDETPQISRKGGGIG
jgi:hypothetical protein